MSMYFIRDLANELASVPSMHRPSRLLDQQFGHCLVAEDFLAPLTLSPLNQIRHGQCYYRPWRSESKDVGSIIKQDNNIFCATLDVQQFKPEEISVKVRDNFIVVEGTHEERQDEHGFISRNFIRRYTLPEGYELKDVVSSLSSDGVLTISAPKAVAIEAEERVIPIAQTGPHTPVQVNGGNAEEQ